MQVGLVIGKGGRNLKEMKQKFGARVEVWPNYFILFCFLVILKWQLKKVLQYLPGENKFRINGGTLKAVDDARAMILEIINKVDTLSTSYGTMHIILCGSLIFFSSLLSLF